MALRLVYSQNQATSEEIAAEPQTATGLSPSTLVWGAVLLFLLLKLPMLFITNNPEELRDFDHFLRVASGQMAYRDFVWLYGPLCPLIYGTLLKLLPAKLVIVRLLSLVIWLPAMVWVARTLIQHQIRGAGYWLGVVFVSGLSAYPSYSHNHILAASGLVAVFYFWSRFQFSQRAADLNYSFAGVLVVLFCRPVLMGYGVLGLWGVLFLTDNTPLNRFRLSLFYGLGAVTLVAVFRLAYGPGLWGAFFPQPWAILETKSYPNLHYLIPHSSLHPSSLAREGLVLFLKEIRAAMETMVFYLHYFIWPSVILTLTFTDRGQKIYKTAAVSAAFAWVASLDLLHYGFSDPMSEQAMWVRGQYFFAGTALSLYLVLRSGFRQSRSWRVRIASVVVLSVVGMWSYLPWVVGLSHLVRFPRNQFDFPVLTGITTHGDRAAAYEAISFLNTLCSGAEKKVVFPQYEPGIARLVQCQDLFANDSYMFTRMPWYVLKPNETPYSPLGGITNGELIDSVLAANDPAYFVFQGSSRYEYFCRLPRWHSKTIGNGALGRTICWRDPG